MTNQQHPITPPPELVQLWADMLSLRSDQAVFNLAAQWGADQELEACIEWLDCYVPRYSEWSANFRVARRPKPPSLTERALARLTTLEELAEAIGHSPDDTIRQALERLKELERPNDQAKQYMKDA